MAKRSKKKRANPRTNRDAPQEFTVEVRSVCVALMLVLASLFVYAPSLKSNFVYDAHKEIIDEGFITSLANLPTVLSLKVLGMDLMLGDRPGQLLYLMLIAVFSGKDPFGYHLCSNLLHAVNVGLLFLLLTRLIAGEVTESVSRNSGKIIAATAVATLIFALHPLAVESVAEVSYSSSLLVTFFTLLALHAGMFFDPQKKHAVLLIGGFGVLCALAAVTCKESGIATSILLVVYWFLYRRGESRGPWLWFLFAASAVSVLFLIARFSLAKHDQGHLHFLGGFPFQVFIIQPRLWVFMMGKLIWPVGLSADYTPVDQLGLPFGLALAFLLTVMALQGWLASRSRMGALGVATYWAGLVTVSNFVPLYRPLADRFYYLPMVGVSLQLLAFLLMTLPSPQRFWAIIAPLGVALLPLTTLTLKRETVFADDFSLWTDTLAVSPLSAVAQSGLGWALYQKGQFDEAISHFNRAIEINSEIAEAHNNLGLALYQKGEWDNAITQFLKAEQLDPDTAQIPNNMGLALAQKGQLGDAIVRYQQALSINPNFVEAHNNLGMVLAQQGRLDEAIVQYRRVLDIVPGQAETHNNLAIVLAQKGQMNDAIAEFQEAVRLKPDYLTAQNNLSKARSSTNQSTLGK